MFDGHIMTVRVPEHVAQRIRETIAEMGTVGGTIDNEAARHGAIALMGTIGATWILRPDGTLWNVDEDFDVPLTALPEEDHLRALFYGIDRFPWLSELRPLRPFSTLECPVCRGVGGFCPVDTLGSRFRSPCSSCDGLGWARSPK